MLKKITIGLLISTTFCLLLYLFILRGNNRLTVLYHHGLWLPSSTSKISFSLYPSLFRFADDWAANTCEMRKKDFIAFISKQKYKYVVKVDTSLDKTVTTIHESNFTKIPDSLLHKFPVNLKCKSPTGDFLIIDAKDNIDDFSKVQVTLYTDWN